jgi:hypothetical protein
MKLFTIGDSISQGFMSAAAARTDLSYSTRIARALGMHPGSRESSGIDYYYPEWKHGGLPTNIEDVFRKLNRKYGNDISGLEWLSVLRTINSVLDESEDYYERGQGKADNPYPGNVPFFHNVSVRDFDVADAWLVTPSLCREKIAKTRQSLFEDGFLTGASAPIFRTALKVLDPNLDKNFSQLDWLEYHAAQEGVENLILWLGANNALRTVLTLKIVETPNTPDCRPGRLGYDQRRARAWNLWHPRDFEDEYGELMKRINAIMQNNRYPDWHVFIATVPNVTIIPLIKGVGPSGKRGEKGYYYKYYTYFPFSEGFAEETGLQLSREEAVYIDECIEQYNEFIKDCIQQYNSLHAADGNRQPFHLVDICSCLNRMAFQRNNGNPTYQYPPFFSSLESTVDTRYYHVDPQGGMQRGGLFSLDGIHPSAICQGLIAGEFTKVMQAEANIGFKLPLDWDAVFREDTLYQEPITMMQEVYQHEKLASHVVRLIQFIKG